jgi:hypothetical protein
VEKPKSQQRSRTELLDEAYAIYRDRTSDTQPVASRPVQFRADYAHPDFNIACIGVWDTVGALGIPVETPVTSPIRQVNQMVAGFHDVTLSAYVDCAFHALALNERREAFKPTLWVQQPHAAAAGQILEQVWFPGAHSDVGGGYGASERGIANVTLRWMVNRVADTCSLEFDPRPLVQREGDRCGFVVHDSMGWVYKAGNAVGLMQPFRRIVDGGLCDGGVRDADRVITEALHSSAERFAIDASATGPFDPTNVHDYIARRAKENGQPEPPPLHRDRRRAEMKEADVDEVTLQRRDEMGRVISTLTLHRDGKARYVGLDPAPRRGTFVGSVAPADFTEVARHIIGTSFFELADRYGSRSISRKATAVTVRSGRRRKSVLSYEGLGPTRLDDVGRAIETAETHVSWDR